MLEFYPNLNSGLMQNINHPLNVSAHETNSNTSLDCNIRGNIFNFIIQKNILY